MDAVNNANPIFPKNSGDTGVDSYRHESGRRFCSCVKIFFKNLWQHKWMLGQGLLLIGGGLLTVFVDVVGMGLPAPFLAPITYGGFYLGGGLVALAIARAFHETGWPSATFKFSSEFDKRVFLSSLGDHTDGNSVAEQAERTQSNLSTSTVNLGSKNKMDYIPRGYLDQSPTLSNCTNIDEERDNSFGNQYMETYTRANSFIVHEVLPD